MLNFLIFLYLQAFTVAWHETFFITLGPDGVFAVALYQSKEHCQMS